MTVPARPRRSVLYMPGSNARAIEKARSLDADGIILDLEDAVAPDAKAAARAQVAAAVSAGGFGPREVVVRVNALDTPWFEDDLASAAAAGPDAVLIPKVSSPETLQVVGGKLAALGAPATLKVWAMVETPLSVLRATEIALAAQDPATRLAVLVLGTNDLAKETGAWIVPGRLPMLSWLSMCVLAARAGGIGILDGVWNAFQDVDGFTRECDQGAELGFDGKTLIHPGQIGPCNAAFSPPEAEVAQARALIAVFDRPENAGLGVVQIEGRMFERLHAEMARRTVALAEAIAARAG
ncbi:MAG TPA: CoA ester lyase [Xanthobacteraceae bacterium]|nr:CoA ester lyase [Xanthobacteraceae bacterium]